ncbi:MAG: hypothetical protein GFH27_549307n45 [Chloroflexi bacterium AL-W]|nr:hypothetical protein [Chloroflexi bacterium AL-N1]NOK69077.1 hypothetical protein [Chloroflexi bacterium AL-N10]NOK77060.1 hypothetical protein [Chloroflexi bacterium AL-N5]NOK83705.1 hypothetical protein [Chloroflexi bacterium AL-W]NOK90915.1 hypothetical protein [Chloroflexi bacterium AL-N15]
MRIIGYLQRKSRLSHSIHGNGYIACPTISPHSVYFAHREVNVNLGGHRVVRDLGISVSDLLMPLKTMSVPNNQHKRHHSILVDQSDGDDQAARGLLARCLSN